MKATRSGETTLLSFATPSYSLTPVPPHLELWRAPALPCTSRLDDAGYWKSLLYLFRCDAWVFEEGCGDTRSGVKGREEERCVESIAHRMYESQHREGTRAIRSSSLPSPSSTSSPTVVSASSPFKVDLLFPSFPLLQVFRRLRPS